MRSGRPRWRSRWPTSTATSTSTSRWRTRLRQCRSCSAPDGSFVSGGHSRPGAIRSRSRWGDFNGDADPDLAVARSGVARQRDGAARRPRRDVRAGDLTTPVTTRGHRDRRRQRRRDPTSSSQTRLRDVSVLLGGPGASARDRLRGGQLVAVRSRTSTATATSISPSRTSTRPRRASLLGAGGTFGAAHSPSTSPGIGRDFNGDGDPDLRSALLPAVVAVSLGPGKLRRHSVRRRRRGESIASTSTATASSTS